MQMEKLLVSAVAWVKKPQICKKH